MDLEKVVSPRKIVDGEIRVPGSKSYAQRAIALSALDNHKTTLSQLTECDDVLAALDIIESLGTKVIHDGSLVYFQGGIDIQSDHSINCGEAGLSTRLFSAFSLLTERDFKVNGRGSILTRPMDMVVDALEQLSKKVESNEGRLPLSISGKTAPGILRIDGSTSSQLLTGILTVAPFLDFDLTVEVDNLKSIPYIEMTLKVLSDFGLSVDNQGYKVFYVKGGQSVKRSEIYKVEGDWSGASFLVVAALIGGKLRLKGLNKNSLQADKAMLTVIDSVGGSYSWDADDLVVESSDLSSFTFDATHCPDLFPPLVALASMISGESKIKGIHRLKHKESDRATALINEFSKLGIDIRRIDDELIIKGLSENGSISGGFVDSHNDHRMAMALALMSLRSEKDILIKNPESIKKSYPLFFEDLDTITGEMNLT